MRSIAACMVLILAFATVLSASPVRHVSSPTGTIAFAVTRNGVSSIYIIKPNGTGLRRIIVNGASPSFTPGGSILFVRGRDIYSVHISGAGLKRWTHHRNDLHISNPVMSEDRTLIVFNAVPTPGKTEIHMFTVSSNSERTLAEGLDPSLTPDQVVILFARRTAIYQISRSMMSEHPFSPGLMWQSQSRGVIRYPIYGSGNFNGLIYSQLEPGTVNHWNLRAVLFGRGDTPKEMLLATNASQPAFSPDGRSIAFIRRGELYLMHSDGSHQSRITGGLGTLSHPAWWTKVK